MVLCNVSNCKNQIKAGIQHLNKHIAKVICRPSALSDIEGHTGSLFITVAEQIAPWIRASLPPFSVLK